MTMARRSWLKGLVASAVLWTTAQHAVAADDTIKVGILHSLSGTMAISETILKDVMLMQIADLNAKGGLLGKKIEPVVVDPGSNWPLFAEKARELISQDKVAAVFGCWTSVSRKTVLPVFEELNGLLFYPLEYEGEEDSYNVFYGTHIYNNTLHIMCIFGRKEFINLIRQPNNSKSMLLGMISMSHSGKMFNLYTIADGCYGR